MKATERQIARKAAMMAEKTVHRCYYCKKPIDSERDYVTKKIPLQSKGKTKMVARDLHIHCVEEYFDAIELEDRQQEQQSEWDACYLAFKKLYGTENSDKALPQWAVLRLHGLRVGKYTARGQNIKNHKGGYSFEVIRLTILLVTAKVSSTMSTIEFKDERHKINYIMTVIIDNIDMIDRKMKIKQKEQKSLENKRMPDLEKENKPFINKHSVGNSNYKEDIVKSARASNIEKETDDLNSMFE